MLTQTELADGKPRVAASPAAAAAQAGLRGCGETGMGCAARAARAARSPPPGVSRAAGRVRARRAAPCAARAAGAGERSRADEVSSAERALLAALMPQAGAPLARAVASGRRRGAPAPAGEGFVRLEARPVALRGGVRLQVTRYTRTQAFADNLDVQDPSRVPGAVAGAPGGGAVAAEAPGGDLEALRRDLATFRHWRVEGADGSVLEVQFTKKGAVVSRAGATGAAKGADAEATAKARGSQVGGSGRGLAKRAGGGGSGPVQVEPVGHDRVKRKLLAEDAPLLRALGVSGADGRVKASRRAKYVQVCEFLRVLDGGVRQAVSAGRLPLPADGRPWRMADLGCGNAYLTLAAFEHLRSVAEELLRADGEEAHAPIEANMLVEAVGVDVKRQARERNTALVEQLGWADTALFVEGRIGFAELPFPSGGDGAPDIVLALHACDTASDDALAAGAQWRAPLLLAAPCCHKQVQRQLGQQRAESADAALQPLLRHGLLRERLGDVVADASRAQILRLLGYRVDAIEFVDAGHTPKNVLLRCHRTGATAPRAAWEELDAMTGLLGVRPALADKLESELAAARPPP